MNRRVVTLVGVVSVITAVVVRADVAPLPVCCAADFEKLELVSLSGVDAELTRTPPAQGGPALRVAFSKAGDERRFVALQTTPKKTLSLWVL